MATCTALNLSGTSSQIRTLPCRREKSGVGEQEHAWGPNPGTGKERNAFGASQTGSRGGSAAVQGQPGTAAWFMRVRARARHATQPRRPCPAQHSTATGEAEPDGRQARLACLWAPRAVSEEQRIEPRAGSEAKRKWKATHADAAAGQRPQ